MRILIDARRSVERATGIGRLVNGLLQALADREDGHEYLVLAGVHDPLGGRQPPHVERRRLDLPLNSLWIGPTMGKLAREWRADVAYFPFWLAPLAMSCPFVVAIHDLIQVFSPDGFSWAHRALFHTYGRAAARRARRVHALAGHGRDDLHRVWHIDLDRIDVVPPAVSVSATTAEASVAALPADVPVDRPFILYVGNHRPHKNLERLLRAYNRAAPRVASDLVIAGANREDGDRPALADTAAASSVQGRVHFVGQVDDVRLAALYRQARLFVFPSLYEGFGLPPLEAMACGTPVACSNASSLPEVVGDAAVTFDPHDEAAMAAALVEVDASAPLRAELSRKGRARAAAFSWTRSADAWLASIERAAS